jgi:predicted AAA+ superfamily ATPase
MYNNDCKIYLTAANANLFSEKLRTRLTGRYIALDIYPISFTKFSNNYFSLDRQDFSNSEIGTLKKYTLNI